MSKGFTIVEVLIVLAIGGLILTIVFYAVPTLERAGRNNQRRQDVNLILEAVSHYEFKDSANFPPDCGSAGNQCTSNTGGTNPNDNFLQFASKQLSYYTPDILPTGVVLTNRSSASPDLGPNTNLDQVQVYNYAICDASSPGSAKTAGADYSNIVALFALETASSTAPQCQQL